MDYESEDVMVLGAINSGVKKFEEIQNITQIDPKILDEILARLEGRGMIMVEHKKGWMGQKVEIQVTKNGTGEVRRRVDEMQASWRQMVQVYKSGDKKRLGEQMNGFRGMLPMMMFFGIADAAIFSMMFAMIGASITDYVPADQIPEGFEDVPDADGGSDFETGF